VQSGIIPLEAKDSQIVYTQLYGRYGEIPVLDRVLPH
jgi:hypothetical protein